MTAKQKTPFWFFAGWKPQLFLVKSIHSFFQKESQFWLVDIHWHPYSIILSLRKKTCSSLSPFQKTPCNAGKIQPGRRQCTAQNGSSFLSNMASWNLHNGRISIIQNPWLVDIYIIYEQEEVDIQNHPIIQSCSIIQNPNPIIHIYKQ